MTDRYAFYRADIAKPGLLDRDTTDPTDGFYRIISAKSKPDYPVAIWQAGDDTVIKVGNREFTDASSDGQDFRGFGWMKCAAVPKADYDSAMATGFWPDNKNARQMSVEEKMGIDTGSGGNNAPADESLGDQITTLSAKLDATPEPTTQDQANALSGLLDKMRTLLKLAETARVTAKEPHLQAGREVDVTWAAVKAPGEQAGIAGEARRKAFLKKEQARLDKEAADKRKADQAFVDAENERIRKENQKRMDEAQDFGGFDGTDPTVEPPELLPEVAAPAIETQRAVAGSTFGRASGLKKVTVIDTVDIEALAFHFIETKDADFVAYLNERAKKALRGKVTLVGVKTREELQ